MSSIFLSYSRKSEAVVKILIEDIEALGHTVWFDQELKGGQAWWNQILATVRSCDLLVFVLHPMTLSSAACKLEYGYANALGKPILPVLVAEGVSTALLPPALSQIQYVDYRKQDRDAAFRLARAIAIVPPAEPLPDPLPSPPEIPISYLGRLADQIETAPALTYEQQSALVFDLKQSLRDSEVAEDAYALLGKLRRRRDLLATIAQDIDEALANTKKTPEEQHDVVHQNEVVHPVSLQEAGGTSSTIQKIQHPPVPQSLAVASGAVIQRERAVAALVGGLLGMVFGFALWWLGSKSRLEEAFWISLIPAIGAAVAGAIVGTHKRKLIGVCLGVASGWFIYTIVNPGELSVITGGTFGGPLGAILGAVAAQVVDRRKALT